MWCLPALLLASGPPVIRGTVRSATATLSGDFDLWIAVQLLVYAVAAGISVWFLAKQFRMAWSKRHSLPLALTLTLAVSCFFSAFWTSAWTSTLGLSFLFFLGLLVAIQFAACGADSKLPLLRLFVFLRRLSAALIALILLYALIYGFSLADLLIYRIGGGRVGVLALCGSTVFSISFYFLLIGYQRGPTQFFWMAIGIAAVLMAQTRAQYLVLIQSFVVLSFFGMWNARRTRKLSQTRTLASWAILGAALVFAIAAGSFIEQRWTRGSVNSIYNLSARTLIWEWSFDRLSDQPYGFGYATGFRQAFLSMPETERQSLWHRGQLMVDMIGEAHNSYIEILFGSGWPGFIIYLSLLGLMIMRLLRAIRRAPPDSDTFHAAALALTFLLGFLLDGNVTSAYVLPTHQPFGYFLFVCAVIFMAESRARNLWPAPARLPDVKSPLTIHSIRS